MMKLVSSKRDILTIPNALSLFRFILAGAFLWLYYVAEIENRRYWLTGVLALSGITDFLDGRIARKWNMVSEVGKILDPAAADRLPALRVSAAARGVCPFPCEGGICGGGRIQSSGKDRA